MTILNNLFWALFSQSNGLNFIPPNFFFDSPGEFFYSPVATLLQLLITNSHRKPFIHRKQSWRFEMVINEIYYIIDFYSIFKLKSKTKGSIDIGLGFKSLNFVCQFWIIYSRHFFNNQMVWFLFPRHIAINNVYRF